MLIADPSNTRDTKRAMIPVAHGTNCAVTIESWSGVLSSPNWSSKATTYSRREISKRTTGNHATGSAYNHGPNWTDLKKQQAERIVETTDSMWLVHKKTALSSSHVDADAG